MNGKDRPNPRDFKFPFRCRIIWSLVNTSGSAKSKANKGPFLHPAIHPATRTFSRLSPVSKTSTLTMSLCSFISYLGRWQRGSVWASWHLMLMAPGFWKVTIAFSSLRSGSWGSPLQTAVSYHHRNCGNTISLAFLLLHQIELKSIQQFHSCLVGERER